MKRITFRPCTPEDKGHDADCPNGAEERKVAGNGGPSQVATEQYRKGWDAINWGSKNRPVGQA